MLIPPIRQGFLLLNHTADHDLIHKITVTNRGKKAVTLDVSHESAGTALTFNNSIIHKYASVTPSF